MKRYRWTEVVIGAILCAAGVYLSTLPELPEQWLLFLCVQPLPWMGGWLVGRYLGKRA